MNTSTRRVRLLRVTALVVALASLELLAIPAVYQNLSNPGGSRRYIFIDGGAHRGETLRHFAETIACAFLPWEIYAFEPNPHLVPEIPRYPRLSVLEKAISAKDETVEFYFGESTLGGSISADKLNRRSKSVAVEAIDFIRWLSKNFTPEDFVWVKLDIEGAEYPVLEKLLSDGNAKYVDLLAVEFHNEKVGVPKAKDKDLVKELRKNKVAVQLGAASPSTGDWFRPRCCLYWSWCSLGMCGKDYLYASRAG